MSNFFFAKSLICAYKASMEEKKMFATRIDPELLKRLKHLSVDTEKTISELTEEAFKDILDKYSGTPTDNVDQSEK